MRKTENKTDTADNSSKETVMIRPGVRGVSPEK